jgi:flagellar hook-associated protein 2
MSVDYLSALNSKGSGLNITQIVDSLVQAETAPQKDLLQDKIDKRTTAISALATLSSELGNLKTSISGFAGTSKYAATSTSTGNTISVSDTSSATPFTSDVQVTALATSQTLEFSGYTSPTQELANGSISVDFGTWNSNATAFTRDTSVSAVTATISDSNKTLAGIASSLNALSGVSASIVKKAENSYSLLVRSETGADNALRLTVTPTTSGSTITALDTTSDNNNHQTVAASNAALTVDGISIARESNTIADLFEGYTLDLTTTTSSTFRVSGALDTTTAYNQMQSFIDSLNSSRTKLNELTKTGSATTEAGPLNNDPVAAAVVKKLRSLTNGALTGFGTSSLYLSNLGVRTNLDGTLTLTKSSFENALATDATTFDAIFNSTASSDSDFLSVTKSSSADITPGTYAWTFDSSSSAATLGGTTLTTSTDSDGNTVYAPTSGDLLGVSVTPSQNVATANIFIGKSLIDTLSDYIDETIKSAGDLSNRKTQITSEVADLNLDSARLDERMEEIRTRYTKQFSAMEALVTSMNNTGEFLTNMMDAFNKDS